MGESARGNDLFSRILGWADITATNFTLRATGPDETEVAGAVGSNHRENVGLGGFGREQALESVRRGFHGRGQRNAVRAR